MTWEGGTNKKKDGQSNLSRGFVMINIHRSKNLQKFQYTWNM